MGQHDLRRHDDKHASAHHSWRHRRHSRHGQQPAHGRWSRGHGDRSERRQQGHRSWNRYERARFSQDVSRGKKVRGYMNIILPCAILLIVLFFAQHGCQYNLSGDKYKVIGLPTKASNS